MAIKFLLPFICLFSSINIYSQVVINEIQAAPQGDEPEWIELFNFSSQPATLDSVLLCDAAGCKALPFITIPAGGYAVLTKDSSSLAQCRKLPPGTILIECKIPSFNNDWDVAVLKNNKSIPIDSAYYNMAWGVRGVSLERRDWLMPATCKDNLMASLSKDSATAGYTNSVSPHDYDISCISDAADPLLFKIVNSGRNAIDSARLHFYISRSARPVCSKAELFASVNITGINPRDTIKKSIDREDVRSWINSCGSLFCSAVVTSARDKYNNNDTAQSRFYINYPPGTVTINEFMTDVSPGNAEFIELYNSYSDTICLEGWSIYDGAALKSGKRVIISDPGFAAPPGSYAVVAWDKEFFSRFNDLDGNRFVYISTSGIDLNSGGDIIVLREPVGNTQDSLEYSSKWHSEEVETTKDRSLEKYNVSLPSHLSSSWTTCGDSRGATPLKTNSVSIEKKEGGTISASPNPFSPKGKLGENVCLINYRLPFRQAKIKAEIYDTDGNILRKLINNEFTSSSGSFAWDGRNDSGFTQPPGAYVLFLEAVDTGSNDVHTEKILIAIGE